MNLGKLGRSYCDFLGTAMRDDRSILGPGQSPPDNQPTKGTPQDRKACRRRHGSDANCRFGRASRSAWFRLGLD